MQLDSIQKRALYSQVEAIWLSVLGLPKIESHRSFMDLGGTSLNANQIIAKLKAEMGLEVPVVKIFEHPTLNQFINFLSGDSREETTAPSVFEQKSNESDFDRDIAIIGMACRFPGAKNLDEFWQNLVDQKDSIQFLSDDELCDSVTDELKQDPRYVKARGQIDQPFGFDAEFFDIGPSEAKLIDPQQRVLLETAFEALELVTFGTNHRLVGILNSNEPSTDAPVVLMFNSGFLHRVGPYRLWVDSARAYGVKKNTLTPIRHWGDWRYAGQISRK